MAQQTKSKSTRTSGGGRSKTRGNSSTSKRTTKSRANSSGSQSRRGTQSRAGSTARKRSNSSNSSSSKGTVANAKDASIKAAKSTGDAVGSTAKKLRTPALAAGAGLAGLAGGIALTRSRQTEGPGRSTARARHHQEPRRRCEEHRCARRAGRSRRRAGTSSRRGARGQRGSPIPDRSRPPGPDEAVPSSKIRLTSANPFRYERDGPAGCRLVPPCWPSFSSKAEAPTPKAESNKCLGMGRTGYM